jgi:hypothetical protein
MGVYLALGCVFSGRSRADGIRHKISKREGIRYFTLQDSPVL